MSDAAHARRLETCRLLVKMRSAIGDSLGFTLCPNPIWDMLLDLYLARHEDREVYLWPLCIASHIPFSTAHRKVAKMVKRGLVVRQNGGRDKRRINISMTGRGSEVMDRLLDRLFTRIGEAGLDAFE